MVAVADDRIVGFAWALTSPESELACVEYFAIDEEARRGGTTATVLMSALLIKLSANGKKRLVGFIDGSAKGFDTLIRWYHSFGMQAHSGVLLTGSINDVVEGIAETMKREQYGIVKTNANTAD